MEINSLNRLTRVNASTDLYDLFSEIFVNNNTVSIFSFQCKDRHRMRLDLVAYDIYGNTDNVDALMVINSITNPFTIDEGDVIFYTNATEIDAIRSDSQVVEAIKAGVAKGNAGKSQKSDTSRTSDKAKQKQIEKQKTIKLPHLVSNIPNVTFEEGQIILKPNF